MLGENMNESEFEKKVEAIVEASKEGFKTDAKSGVQSNLARLLVLLNKIRKSKEYGLLGPIEVAAKGLLAETPLTHLSNSIIRRTERELSIKSTIFGLILSGTAPTRVILGLGTLLYFAIPLGLYLLLRFDNLLEGNIVGIPVGHLILVGISGTLGSIVSIMVRIGDFAKLNKEDPVVLFFTGFFKPIVGASFALFVFAVIQAKLIPIQLEAEFEQYFFLALAFVSGFSERFARDVASKIEKQVVSPN